MRNPSHHSAKRVKPSPRIPFLNQVWLRSPAAARPIQSSAGNLSETGIFVQTSDPPEVDSLLKLQFQMTPTSQIIEVMAKVVWIKPFEPINVDGLLPGVGLHFVELTESDRTEIRDFIHSYLQPLTEREDNKDGPQESTPSTDDAKQTYPVEQPMVLQIKGEEEPILGYSQAIDSHKLHFVADFVPKNSLFKRISNSKLLHRLKGYAAFPIQLEKVRKNQVELSFVDLRNDLMQPLPETRIKSANPSTAKPNADAKETTTKPQNHTSLARETKWLVALLALTCFLLGLWLGSLLL